jgi:DEAD/DEAH box helicase domain-containing protein
MSIFNFIESLKNDRKFSLQIIEHRHIPPAKAQYVKLVLSARLKDVLKKHGINLFYSHQVEAINLIRQEENVMVMTPTASGKSLIYNIPVLESIIENPELKALYIFPLKGLEQDQVRNLNALHDAVEGINTELHSNLSPSPPCGRGQG